MSGAVAAHAAYNGSGTQGLAVTNKIQDQEGDVMSVFWNKNDTTRQLLHGAAFIDIPTSGNGGTTTYGGNQIFTVNNDIDAIGELFLQITATAGSSQAASKVSDLAGLIKRIEFHVGTQIWHTLEKEDIAALNSTEMPEGVYSAAARSLYGSYDGGGKKNPTAQRNTTSTYSGRDLVAGATISGVLRIPTVSRKVCPSMSKFTNVVENAYLVAAAPHQTVKIKVYLEKADTAKTNVWGAGTTALPTLELKLFGQHLIMCNEEREQMKAMSMGLPKRLKMSQNVTQTVSGSSTDPVTIDLDHFSLYASHLVITAFGAASDGFTLTDAITDVELKLNSSSFAGTLSAPLLQGPMSDMLGLHFNAHTTSVRHTDGSVKESLEGDYSTYVFPLASRAYSGSGVPLNRFDNIRLTVTPGSAVQKIVVTCVGETTALYKNGAASLAMY
jgi:hypothetical protein